ncbi:hypothetical protein ALC60_12001 [Trachymyrmex zeteki]|uniref:Uncharacterized protein n=1 Tax=Mycetomoellerius zeteki TaxID=64791 RepID=A0A151WM68_9HYME|nr:hypothetical protein ALC60_12001 [Trachymyrmex zeteki]
MTGATVATTRRSTSLAHARLAQSRAAQPRATLPAALNCAPNAQPATSLILSLASFSKIFACAHGRNSMKRLAVFCCVKLAPIVAQISNMLAVNTKYKLHKKIRMKQPYLVSEVPCEFSL